MKRRQKLLNELSSILQEDLTINKEMAEMVSEVMDVSACYLLKAEDKMLTKLIHVGREVDWQKLVPEIELSTFSKKCISNIRDLYAYGLIAQVKSCLILPFTTNSDEYAFVLIRENSEFDGIDEQYANEIKAILSSYDLNMSEKEHLEKSRIKAMLSFQLKETGTFEFIEILNDFKHKIGLMFEIDSSSVYIANQKDRLLWTKNTHSSDALIFPIAEDSIMGYTYLNQIPVLYPDSNIHFQDLSHYQDKFVACLPIIEASLTNPVIGIILITKSSIFTEFELWIAKKYSETFGSILYVQFLEIINKNLASETESHSMEFELNPDSLFMQVNKSSSTRRSIQDSYQQNKIPEIEKLLANILKCEHADIVTNDYSTDDPELDGALAEAEYQQECQYIPSLQSNQLLSFLVVPLEATVFACFHNFEKTLEAVDIKQIQSLTKLLYSAQPFHSIHQVVIEEARFESLVYKWTSKLISISNSNLHKLLTCKSVIYKLASKNDIRDLCYMALDIICALTNSLSASIIFQEDIGFLKLTNQQVSSNVSEEEQDLFELCAKSKNILKLKGNRIEENSIVVPIMFNEVIGILLVSEKKDDTDREYTKFSSGDEKFLQDFAKCLSQSLSEFPTSSPASLQILSQHIRYTAISYKPQSLFVAIRKASQVIFDCDKVNLFLLSIGKLSLVTQGIEDEISEGFSMALEGSIYCDSMKSGKCEAINDAYNHPRFNPEIDKITGYKTTSMLVVPIKNSHGEAFCLLECVNKRKDYFKDKDIQNSLKICQVFERVLENWELMKRNIEEIFRLKGISNSIASYILVFNHERKLSYTNKPIEEVFGVSESEVRGIQFSVWLKINEGLKEDIDSVYANPSLKIRRTSQKIKSGRIQRVPSLDALIFEDKKTPNVFEYRVVQLQDLSNESFSGVVLIMEDNSALEALHQEFREVQDQLRAITSPIATETGLQKCIRELNSIVSSIKLQETKDKITEVIDRLKAGGLKKPKFMLHNVDKQEFETVNSIFYMDEMNFNTSPTILYPRKISIGDLAQTIPLAVLRDWNLNAFAITGKYNYIYSMLSDFGAIEQYQISDEILYNFVSSVQNECNKRQNPFHNFTHCFSVMHSLYMLLSSTSAGSFFTGLSIFGLLIAAMCHDVDHTGRTNMFEVNSKSKLAITYNDKSVLEQHHAAVAFEILLKEESNIFYSLPPEQNREIRKIMITAIMGTDMSKHYSILTNINARCNDIINNPIGSLPKDKEKLAQFILHTADLAHPTKAYRTYEMWSLLVCQEFSDQHKEEIAKNLPTTEFMKDLDIPKVYYANEIGFLNYVVRPLWECADNLLKPNISFLVENLYANVEEMKKKLEEWKKAES